MWFNGLSRDEQPQKLQSLEKTSAQSELDGKRAIPGVDLFIVTEE